MAGITGLLALALVFWSGPYHTLQIRRPDLWGHRLSTRAHSNVSLAALVAVVVHVGPSLGVSLTWVGTWLFLVAVGSGLYGLYRATGSRREGWLRWQRLFAYAFYAGIAPHVVGSLFGWVIIPGAIMAWAIWRWRPEQRKQLSKGSWPLMGPVAR